MATPTHDTSLNRELFNIYEFQRDQSTNTPGYFVVSTAPIDVDNPEDEPSPPDRNIFKVVNNGPEASAEEMIKRITDTLVESKTPELIIDIHGYNNNFLSVQNRYKEIYQYIKTDPNIRKNAGSVFIGYRWPSEDLRSLKVGDAFRALPILPRGVLVFGLLLTILTAILLVPLSLSWILLLVLFVITFSLILALIGLRLTVYFRDNYRAINFGVPDLVELLRQIDRAAFEITLLKKWDIIKAPLLEIGITEEEWRKEDLSQKREIWETVSKKSRGIIKNKIKLTFIGHSLGCLVITNSIRILSDVFDPSSVGTLDKYDPEKQPSPKIGNAFCLGRLVLVAPDIPVETVVPRRANFLRSALRRFEEAYIFSNEGDLALRLASTAANYLNFPARTRSSGYRLGNITVRHFDQQNQKFSKFPKQGYSPAPKKFTTPPYGIVNSLGQNGTQNDTYGSPYEYLEIRSSDWEHQSLSEIRSPDEIRATKPIANLFTYFDCTDYKETQRGPGLVSHALGKPALNLLDYARLFFTKFGDTHGGYFKGELSQKAMYQLAFLGFKGFLSSYKQQHSMLASATEKELLQKFSDECSSRQVQVILAPERYEVDLLGKQRDRSGY